MSWFLSQFFSSFILLGDLAETLAIVTRTSYTRILRCLGQDQSRASDFGYWLELDQYPVRPDIKRIRS